MKKLLKKLRDWRSVKLGGVTPAQLSLAIGQWTGEIAGLNRELAAYQNAERMIAKQEQKNIVNLKAEETLWNMEAAAGLEDERLDQIREFTKIRMATELGRKLLKEGVILIREENRWGDETVVMKMEVKVVC